MSYCRTKLSSSDLLVITIKPKAKYRISHNCRVVTVHYTNKKFWEELSAYFPLAYMLNTCLYDRDGIENTASKCPSIVSYIFVAVGNVFTRQLPSNDHLFQLHYSGFKTFGGGGGGGFYTDTNSKVIHKL
jgi:hypothetical protein